MSSTQPEGKDWVTETLRPISNVLAIESVSSLATVSPMPRLKTEMEMEMLRVIVNPD